MSRGVRKIIVFLKKIMRPNILFSLALVVIIVINAMAIEYVLVNEDNSHLIQILMMSIAILILWITFFIIYKNNTKLKNNQKVIKESEERYRLISENVIEMISKHSLDGRYTYLSASCKKILGYEPEELIGVNPYDLFHPDSIEAIKKTHDTILNSSDTDISKYKIRRKDGTYVWLETSNSVITEPETNNQIEILCVSRDVTKKVENENLYKKMIEFSEELLRTGEEQVTYQQILNNLLYLSKAKYAALTLINENTGKFTTIALTGLNDKIKKITEVLGYNPIGKEWDNYDTENKDLQGQIDVRFPSISALAGNGVVLDIVSKSIEKLLNIGEVSVTKVIVNNQMIGDFTLIMAAGEHFQNDYLVKIYSRQIDMFITRLMAEQKLKESERRLIAAQKMAHVGNWELNLKTKYIWASEEAFNIYGLDYSNPVISLDTVQKLSLPEYRKTLDNALDRTIRKGDIYDEKFKIKKADTEEECFVHSKAVLDLDDKGDALKIIGTIEDITSYKKAEEEIMYLSYNDQLTGLSNRRYYEEALKKLEEEFIPLTLVMIDLNGLKLTNDAFGHNAGDMLLKKAANIFKKVCGVEDIVARMGGDEFVLLLPYADEKKAQKIIDSINNAISNEETDNIVLSISIGKATRKDTKENIAEVYKRAEDEMYRNKLYESSSMRSKTIDIIVNTLYEKSEREMFHSKRTSELCEITAKKMGLDNYDINHIRLAGLMHDIGKIGIDEKILNKDGALTISEWFEIKRHCEVGYRILSSVNEFSDIANHVLEHHERWDGTGYPKGLLGDEISIEARIIAIADSYDAMTSHRSYRKGFSEDEAVCEVIKNAGTQFDPNIARIFVEKVLGKEWK